ncbi:unnamed protein product [Eruca vesicaria subsp. sativa]|uniref:Uncharacterized protein n=1 Tax=Eruca vesicaria subsp. sativa TaxID=29727 RepID=A0ABC8LGZ3_ERUVS|nr:unnamed protein product [Eruca vesicaria subsp. sativa]
MTISHVQLLPLFLASLFCLPSSFPFLYAIKFENCKGVANNVGNVTNLTLSPTGVDNKYTLYVSMDTKKLIFLDAGVAILKLIVGKMAFRVVPVDDFCSCVDTLPIQGGKNVNFSFTNVSLQNGEHEGYDKATLTFGSQDRIEMCINFNLNSVIASAAVSP